MKKVNNVDSIIKAIKEKKSNQKIMKKIENGTNKINHVTMKKYLKMIRKWGGFLIVVGALLPIPFSITSITAGLIQYKFRNFLLFGLLRFVRFYLYAVVIFNVL